MDDQALVHDIKEKFSKEATDDLLERWIEHDRHTYSASAFTAVGEILTERGVTLPEQHEIVGEPDTILVSPVRWTTNLGFFLVLIGVTTAIQAGEIAAALPGVRQAYRGYYSAAVLYANISTLVTIGGLALFLIGFAMAAISSKIDVGQKSTAWGKADCRFVFRGAVFFRSIRVLCCLYASTPPLLRHRSDDVVNVVSCVSSLHNYRCCSECSVSPMRLACERSAMRSRGHFVVR